MITTKRGSFLGPKSVIHSKLAPVRVLVEVANNQSSLEARQLHQLSRGEDLCFSMYHEDVMMHVARYADLSCSSSGPSVSKDQTVFTR